ncbi:MAG: hypothetical protein SF187_10180 [Deltaproteobacteria bacterium]|nr:hypothetical protein [Deltaproteobacteria bacterium]
MALFTTSVVLCFVPLHNLLGYDFAFVIGLIAAFAGADVGHDVVAKARRTPMSTSNRSVWSLALTAAVKGASLLVLPLLAISLNAVRTRNCSFAAGFAFYALLPLSSVVFAATIGMLCGLLSVRQGRRLALLAPIVSMLWACWRVYVDPPVYALDPFGGFFPGPIYDEALSPPARLVLFRLANLLWLVAVLAAADLVITVRGANAPRLDLTIIRNRRWRKTLTGTRVTTAFVLAAGAIGVFAFGGQFGFRRSQTDLRQHLSRVHTTAHFRVFSSPGDGQSPAEMALFLSELEFRYHQLKHTLQTEPRLPVTVFLFPSAESKKDLVGAGSTLFTKPWRQEMFVQVADFPPENLRHEMAHIFAASFGDPVFGISLRWWPWPRLASGLVEGIAEASDFSNPEGQATLHQDARHLVQSKQAPSLTQIMGAGFTVVAGPQAYTLAASFTHFVLERFGAPALQKVYRSGGDWVGSYGAALPELETRWKAFLQQQPLNEDQKANADERYRRPAIFKKVCARDLAARVQEALRLRTHQPEKAVALLQSVCTDDPDEPGYRLSLAYAHVAAKQPEVALRTIEGLSQRTDLTRPLRRRVASFKASLALARKDVDQALAAETEAFQLATEQTDRRTSVARLRALKDPVARATLGRVLFGDSPAEAMDPALVVYLLSEFAKAFPDEALGPYLLGRQLLNRDPTLAFTTLQQACPESGDRSGKPMAIPLPPLFQRECWRLVGQSAYRAGLYENARAAWRAALSESGSESGRLRAKDWLERLDWAQAQAAN